MSLDVGWGRSRRFGCSSAHSSIGPMPRTVRVAVIGSGLAGLTAAYLLSNSSNENVLFDVHLFEKARLTQASTIGMDCSSISLPNPGNKEEWRVDVPMRSFQGGYYKKLISLYRFLGVGFRASNFSYSFSNLHASTHGRSQHAYCDAGRVEEREWAVVAWNEQGLGAPLICILGSADSVLLYSAAIPVGTIRAACWDPDHDFPDMGRGYDPQRFFGPFAEVGCCLEGFYGSHHDTVVLAVCTAPREDILKHPMEEFLDYIWLTLGTHHYVATNGVQDVVSRLTARISHIHLSSTISKISINPDNPSLAFIECSSSSGITTHSDFHHIILATQANRAIPLLQSLASSFPLKKTDRCRDIERQIDCLKRFSYAPTIVINHTDDTLIPGSLRDRRDLNLISAAEVLPEPKQDAVDADSVYLPSTYTMASHILQRPKCFPSHLPTVFQTTNPIVPIRQSRILSVAKLDRAVLTLDAKQALEGLQIEIKRSWQCAGQGKSRLGKLQGGGRVDDANTVGVWICGSFAHSGIPLLEGCIMSARNVVEQGIWRCEGYHDHIYW
ncbi:hypothetical protein D9758_007390 [Tetrapyrgos nigripes]|uniref:FAD/NAD(P)-binding domain-containing protein n=1 Tax=Tetrapyrgos nigripes TaxID=182062 RepID=A0A8H5LLF8_9AGAR|nr:hypothetical protein D9758_007390 [Tetrapyrgos nigripes]